MPGEQTRSFLFSLFPSFRREAFPMYGMFSRVRRPQQLARASANPLGRQKILLQNLRQNIQQNVASQQTRGRRLRHAEKRRIRTAATAATLATVTTASKVVAAADVMNAVAEFDWCLLSIFSSIFFTLIYTIQTWQQYARKHERTYYRFTNHYAYICYSLQQPD